MASPDFTFDDDEEEPDRSEVAYTLKLKNQYNRVFYGKLTYSCLAMPDFGLRETGPQTRLIQRLYFSKHLLSVLLAYQYLAP